MNFLYQISKPKLSTIELIAIDLTSEYMSVDSDCQLFRSLPLCLSSNIERNMYNRRKRKLFFLRDSLCKKLASQIAKQDYFILDSMPLEVCKVSRTSRSPICKEDDKTPPDRDYCVFQAASY